MQIFYHIIFFVENMIRKWLTKSEKNIGNFRIFDLNSVERSNFDNTKSGEFFYLNSPEWVNIIPVTKDNKIVFVEQYRHGSDSITLELPAGLVERNESPIAAAKRECTEETGYTGDGNPELLGIILPNPAFMNNRCHSYVWLNCSKKYEQTLDSNEEIEIHLLDFDEAKRKMLKGEINHSLVLDAFFYYSLKYKF